MKVKVKSNIYLDIEKAIASVISERQFSLIDMDIIGGKNRHIVIFVYKDSIGINDLESLSRMFYPVLEKVGALKEGFSLELSTPGIFRIFKYTDEFNIFRGRQVKLVMDDGNVLTGTLNGLVESDVEIVINGQMNKIDLNKVKTAKLNG